MHLDVDHSIVEVHGYAKQGAGFGYSGVRGLNMTPQVKQRMSEVGVPQDPPGGWSPQRCGPMRDTTSGPGQPAPALSAR